MHCTAIRGRLLASACRQCKVSRRCLNIDRRQTESSPSASRPSLDFDYILDEQNRESIRENIKYRKQVGDIDAVHDHWSRIHSVMTGESPRPATDGDWQRMWDELYAAAADLPNMSDERAPRTNEPLVVDMHGTRQKSSVQTPSLEKVGQKLSSLRASVKHACGERAYVLAGALARLHTALLDYAVDFVLAADPHFHLVDVPDAVRVRTATACGLQQRSAKNIMYTFKHDPQLCLSGTAELGINEWLAGTHFQDSELPRKYMALTRCYRSEAHEQGMYRVHEFDKLEMFAVTAGDVRESSAMLEHFVTLQRRLYDSLQLHFRVLRMPTQELGAPAFAKYDCEAMMYGRMAATGNVPTAECAGERGYWGEISSASNCTDYQSRRLHITHGNRNSPTFVHTVNGTAAASIRLLIAVTEQAALHPSFAVSPVLQPYIESNKSKQNLKLIPVDPRTQFD